MASNPINHTRMFRSLGRIYQSSHAWRRTIVTIPKHYNAARPEDSDIKKELTITKPVEILQKEFPNHFKDGKFISRMSYVEFIDEARVRLKEFGMERDIEAYKELLRIFPPGKFWPKRWDGNYGLFSAPQQLAVVRLLQQMEMMGVKPDKDIERLIVDAFSNRSDVWVKVARMNYWSMKGRNLDPNPLPEALPKEPHQLAKLGISRMLDDRKSLVTVTNTSRVPDSVDKTWLVFSQSPSQKEIIANLHEKSTLYIEEGGRSYVGRDFLSYYILKYYVDDETRARKSQKPPPDYNYNTLKVRFFGKPVGEKFAEPTERHYVDGAYILAICATGTSSQDSLLSWLKILQGRNPNLSNMNVVFKMSRPSPDIVHYQENKE